MTTFDDREAAFENKFAHDAELKFRIESRANAAIAQWAGEKLGKSAAEMEAYTKEVIRADFEEPGPEDVIRKLADDLSELASLEDIRAAYSEALKAATSELV